MLTKEQVVAAGKRADEIINDTIFQEAVKLSQGRIFTRWGQTAPTAKEEREQLYARFGAIEELIVSLNIIRNEGIASATEIEKENAKKASS